MAAPLNARQCFAALGGHALVTEEGSGPARGGPESHSYSTVVIRQ